MKFQMDKFNAHLKTILCFYSQNLLFSSAHFRCIALELGVFDNSHLICVLDCLISAERLFHFEICLEWNSLKVDLTIFVPYVKKNVFCTFRKREKHEMKSINKLSDHRMWWISNMLLNAWKQSTNVFRQKKTILLLNALKLYQPVFGNLKSYNNSLTIPFRNSNSSNDIVSIF